MFGEPCETCGNKYPVRRQFCNESNIWICDRCGASEIFLPDVYFDGKPEVNLADGPDGKPITFLTRGQKANYLKERGICEAGDKFHGAPFTTLLNEDKDEKRRKSMEAVRNARREVEQMGRDVRRREFLKVVRESEAFMKKGGIR